MDSGTSEIIRQSAYWMQEHKEVLALVVSFFALIRPLRLISWFLDRQTRVPRIVFSRTMNESDNIVTVEALNIGSIVASDVRITWSPRFPCTMNHIPQPITLLPGVPATLTFIVDSSDLHLHQILSDGAVVLGVLELTFRGRSRGQQRTGFSLTSQVNLEAFSTTSITLDRVPRRTLRERWRLAEWIQDVITQPERRARKAAEQQRQLSAQWYEDSKAFLETRGVLPDNNQYFSQDLVDELGRRGWHWRYAPGGIGYEANAEKEWWPSSSHSITFSAATPEEVLVKVLAAAIEEDERQKPHAASMSRLG